MNYTPLMYFHLVTIVPCIFLGAYLLLAKKSTGSHRKLGRIYMTLMVATSVSTFFMPAKVGFRLFDHFGWIHGFSILTLYSVPTAYLAIKKGNVRSHKIKMIMLYIGAILIAGGFTLAPGRFLHGVFFG